MKSRYNSTGKVGKSSLTKMKYRATNLITTLIFVYSKNVCFWNKAWQCSKHEVMAATVKKRKKCYSNDLAVPAEKPQFYKHKSLAIEKFYSLESGQAWSGCGFVFVLRAITCSNNLHISQIIIKLVVFWDKRAEGTPSKTLSSKLTFGCRIPGNYP